MFADEEELISSLFFQLSSYMLGGGATTLGYAQSAGHISSPSSLKIQNFHSCTYA